MKRMPTLATAGLFLAAAAACGGSGTHEHPTIGTAPPENGAGATATVEGTDRRFVETVQEMLEGRVSGLEVVNDPVCGVTLRIRGGNQSLTGGGGCESEPLLIIDDKPVALGNIDNALRGLTSVQIDRIRVLKDVASTSIYGTRGANGVVLITTKR